MSIRLTIDTSKIEAVADALGQVSAESFGQAAVTALNTVVPQTYEAAVGDMTSTINLSPDYVEQRLFIEPAASVKVPEAHIYAPKGSGRGALIGDYSAEQEMTPVRFGNNDPRIVAGAMGENPRKPGAPLPWKKRIGDEKRGIPVGMKAAGVSVEVTRNARKTIKSAFIAPLKNGRLLPVFRESNGKLKALHGPSAWQLFRAAVPNLVGPAEKMLRSELIKEAKQMLRKVLP